MRILLSIEDLLSGLIVEGARMDMKTGWNPKTIMSTICTFANDFENVGSGYTVVGDKEEKRAHRYRNRRIGEFL